MTSRKDKFTDGKSTRGPKPDRDGKPVRDAKSDRDAKPGRDGKPVRAGKPLRDDGKTPRGFVRPEQIVPDPWRVPIAVEQIPDTSVERAIVANATQLTAIAQVGGLRVVHSAQAEMTLQPTRDSHIQVTGRVRARIGQVCVVSLEDIDSDIDEEIDIVFAPPSKIPPMASTIDDSSDEEAEIPDPPEPIEDGIIDIGRVATDALFLAIDPYPRKPGAVLDVPAVEEDPDEHPFAALQVLKGNGKDDSKGRT